MQLELSVYQITWQHGYQYLQGCAFRHGMSSWLIIQMYHLEFGLSLDYTVVYAPSPTLRNHGSDPLDLVHMVKFIDKETRLGAILGPFHEAPFEPWLQWSPMMMHPKKNSREKRIILDLSYPKGA